MWRWLSLSALPSLSGSSHRVHETATSPAHWARLHCQELNPQKRGCTSSNVMRANFSVGERRGRSAENTTRVGKPIFGGVFFFFFEILRFFPIKADFAAFLECHTHPFSVSSALICPFFCWALPAPHFTTSCLSFIIFAFSSSASSPSLACVLCLISTPAMPVAHCCSTSSPQRYSDCLFCVCFFFSPPHPACIGSDTHRNCAFYDDGRWLMTLQIALLGQAITPAILRRVWKTCALSAGQSMPHVLMFATPIRSTSFYFTRRWWMTIPAQLCWFGFVVGNPSKRRCIWLIDGGRSIEYWILKLLDSCSPKKSLEQQKKQKTTCLDNVHICTRKQGSLSPDWFSGDILKALLWCELHFFSFFCLLSLLMFCPWHLNNWLHLWQRALSPYNLVQNVTTLFTINHDVVVSGGVPNESDSCASWKFLLSPDGKKKIGVVGKWWRRLPGYDQSKYEKSLLR